MVLGRSRQDKDVPYLLIPTSWQCPLRARGGVKNLDPFTVLITRISFISIVDFKSLIWIHGLQI